MGKIDFLQIHCRRRYSSVAIWTYIRSTPFSREPKSCFTAFDLICTYKEDKYLYSMFRFTCVTETFADGWVGSQIGWPHFYDHFDGSKKGILSTISVLPTFSNPSIFWLKNFTSSILLAKSYQMAVANRCLLELSQDLWSLMHNLAYKSELDSNTYWLLPNVL